MLRLSGSSAASAASLQASPRTKLLQLLLLLLLWVLLLLLLLLLLLMLTLLLLLLQLQLLITKAPRASCTAPWWAPMSCRETPGPPSAMHLAQETKDRVGGWEVDFRWTRTEPRERAPA